MDVEYCFYNYYFMFFKLWICSIVIFGYFRVISLYGNYMFWNILFKCINNIVSERVF